MTLPSFDLSGKVCFITGTTSGLGRQFALCMSEAGAKVVITGRRKERLEALAEEIRAAGGTAHPIAFDVTDLDAAAAAVTEAEEKVGPIWCLVNNSGVTIMKAAQKHTQDDYDAVMDTNLRAPFYLSQEVAKRMIDRGAPGRIINISSMHADVELKGGITYCMSKAAVAMMTQCMALEWARYGIRVNALCPGYIRTEINSEYYDSEKGQQDIKGWPMRRIGKDTDLNGMLLLLASEAGDFVTGSALKIDDGQSLGF
ncbi:MAG: SDR family NAD(P)-dependent oxidoreductase [Alphaproteobacteria bacterium]|nr:SDR family NAD(P)-dependent oxidoreductase [Alphaproteobacteria bacterium]